MVHHSWVSINRYLIFVKNWISCGMHEVKIFLVIILMGFLIYWILLKFDRLKIYREIKGIMRRVRIECSRHSKHPFSMNNIHQSLSIREHGTNAWRCTRCRAAQTWNLSYSRWYTFARPKISKFEYLISFNQNIFRLNIPMKNSYNPLSHTFLMNKRNCRQDIMHNTPYFVHIESPIILPIFIILI